MNIIEVDVGKTKLFSIGQQYNSNALVIHFVNLPNQKNKYIYYKIDDIEKEVPLVSDLFIVSRPLMMHSGEVKAQIITRDENNSIIELTKNFTMRIQPSNYSGIGEDENYPDDPNIKNYYVKIDGKIQSMDELIALVQSKLDSGEFVGAQGPKGEKGDPGDVTNEYKELANQIAQNATNAQRILDDTKTFANQAKSELNQIKTDTNALKEEANASAVNAKASETKAKEYADSLSVNSISIKDVLIDKTTHTGKYIRVDVPVDDPRFYEVNENFNSSNINEIEPNETYTVICMRYNDGEEINFCDALFFDVNHKYISRVQNTTKFTTPNNAKYFAMTLYSTKYDPNSWDNFGDIIVENSNKTVYPFTKNRLKNVRAFIGCEGKKWMVIGDSITEHNFRALANYHDYIAEELGLEVINCGVSGSGYKVHDTDDNYISTILPFYKRISNYSEYKPDLITVMGGINDLLFSGKQMGEITDTSTDTWFGCVYQLTQNIKATFPNIPFGIMSPLPACAIGNGNILYNFNPSDKTNKEYIFVQKLEEFCDYYCIPFLNQYNKSGFRPWDDDFKLKYTSCRQEKNGDGLHPNVQGHALIYPRIREFVRTLI